MIEVDYSGSGNKSVFEYDGMDRNTEIQEYTSGSVTATKQIVWCGNQRCEARQTGGNTVQRFGLGESVIVSGTPLAYFYSLNHLGSICQMTDSSGNLVSNRNYDPFGRAAIDSESITPDFGYAGYYLHARSYSILLSREPMMLSLVSFYQETEFR